MMYEKGQGISQDDVLAYKWYTAASAMLGGEDGGRDKTSRPCRLRITGGQIKIAQEMARRCRDTEVQEVRLKERVCVDADVALRDAMNVAYENC